MGTGRGVVCARVFSRRCAVLLRSLHLLSQTVDGASISPRSTLISEPQGTSRNRLAPSTVWDRRWRDRRSTAQRLEKTLAQTTPLPVPIRSRRTQFDSILGRIYGNGRSGPVGSVRPCQLLSLALYP